MGNPCAELAFRRGELDIVAARDGQLRFVEVKLKIVDQLYAVGHRKRQYNVRRPMARHGCDCDEVGFMLAIVTTARGEPVISLFDHPFDGS